MYPRGTLSDSLARLTLTTIYRVFLLYNNCSETMHAFQLLFSLLFILKWKRPYHKLYDRVRIAVSRRILPSYGPGSQIFV